MLDFDQVGRDLNWVVKSKKKKKNLEKTLGQEPPKYNKSSNSKSTA